MNETGGQLKEGKRLERSTGFWYVCCEENEVFCGRQREKRMRDPQKRFSKTLTEAQGKT